MAGLAIAVLQIVVVCVGVLAAIRCRRSGRSRLLLAAAATATFAVLAMLVLEALDAGPRTSGRLIAPLAIGCALLTLAGKIHEAIGDCG